MVPWGVDVLLRALAGLDGRGDHRGRTIAKGWMALRAKRIADRVHASRGNSPWSWRENHHGAFELP
jgi:hypothetical protein